MENKQGNIYSILTLAVLGYLFLFVLLLIQTIITIGLISMAINSTDGIVFQMFFAVISMVALVGVVYLVKALFVNLSGDEEGIEVSREAPIWQETIKLCEAMDSPLPDKIYADHEFNASAGVSRRRFSWSKNTYVTLGLPLVAALSKEELLAVLAHELGHHSRNHSKVTGWIYRVRSSWSNAESAMNNMPDLIVRMTERFYNWFIPLFLKKSFAICRDCEFEADKVAADVVGGEHLVSALCRIQILDLTVNQQFWSKVFKQVKNHEKPPFTVISKQISLFEKVTSKDLLSNFKLLDIDKTQEHDTHPCVTERASALDLNVIVPPVNQESGISLMGSNFKEMVNQVNKLWQESIIQQWEYSHWEAKEQEEELADLQRQADEGLLRHSAIRDLARQYLVNNQVTKAFEVIKKLYKETGLLKDKTLCIYYLGFIKGQAVKASQMARPYLGKNFVLDSLLLPMMIDSTDDPVERTSLLAQKELVEEIIEQTDNFYVTKSFGVKVPKPLKEAQISQSDRQQILAAIKEVKGIKRVTLVEMDRHPSYPNCHVYLIMFENSINSDRDVIIEFLYDELWFKDAVYCVTSMDYDTSLYLKSMTVSGSVIYKAGK